jgi:plasmid replication initiation protein
LWILWFSRLRNAVSGMARARRPPPSHPPVPELAVIHNELARARFDGHMGVAALRLMVLLAEKVGYNDNELMSHRFKVSEYARRLGIEKDGRLYARLEEVCDELMKLLVVSRAPSGEDVKFQVMRLAKYYRKEGEMELHFHEEMRPFLLRLREYFARIPLEVFFRIKNAYAVRLYLVCKSWEPADPRNLKPGWSWTVEQLREWLALKPEDYPYTPHLRSAILKRAKKELDAVADVSFRPARTIRTKSSRWTAVRSRDHCL